MFEPISRSKYVQAYQVQLSQEIAEAERRQLVKQSKERRCKSRMPMRALALATATLAAVLQVFSRRSWGNTSKLRGYNRME